MSLLLACRHFEVGPAAAPVAAGSSLLSKSLSVGGVLFAGFVIAAQAVTAWGEGRHPIVLVAYYLIAGWLASVVFFGSAGPKLLLLGWSVALGFFYAEFSGFLVFSDRPAWVVLLAGSAAGVSLLGVVAAHGNLAPASGR